MRVGTKSVLFGAHCFLVHWLFVALGWMKVYGFERVIIGTEWRMTEEGAKYKATLYTAIWDPRLWVAFFVHDLGYWGKPNMDGPEGETHPELGARIMARLFGDIWYTFTVCHSRFYAARYHLKPSPLCFADKTAILFEPRWFYLPRIQWSGEVAEYLKMAEVNSNGKVSGADLKAWHRDMHAYVEAWVAAHKDGRHDSWTTPDRTAATSTGVWQ